MMRALTGELLLAAWEAGARGHELRRPLALLSAALPGTDPAVLSAMPVAARDLELLRLRTLTFGPELAVLGTCPACGERLEFTLNAGELAAGLAPAATAGPAEWTEDGHRYRLRPVTTEDLLAMLAADDVNAAQELLLARCLQACSPEENENQDHHPERARAAPPQPPVPPSAVKRFEELHADGELRCAIECPACSAAQVHDLDIARFFWREVTVAARRLLAEVHALAAAYGWAERDIMRLSPVRRAAYLELAGT
jgi:hypothetical protein